MTKRHVADKIRQKVVEAFRISGDDESGKGRPIFDYFTFWVIGIPFFLFWFFMLFLTMLEGMLEGRGGQIDKIGFWFSATIIEGYVEPFCLGGGIFVVAAIGLFVDFVFVVRDWQMKRRRRRQVKER